MKKLLIVLVVLAGVVVGVGFLLPSKFHVERSVVIQKDASAIHPLIANPSRWPEWSAWTKENYPEMVATYEGPAEGVGAKSNWKDPKNGNGGLVITKSDPATGIVYDLTFENCEPSTAAIAYTKAEGGTQVTMSVDGDVGSNPFYRYLGLLMDKFMGGDFEKGLNKLKTVVEGTASADAKKP
jgi:hypothetical protein